MNARTPATDAQTARTARTAGAARPALLRRIASAAILTAALAVGVFVAPGADAAPQQAATTGTVRVGTTIGTNAVVRGSSWALPASTTLTRVTTTSLARGSSWS